MEAIATKSFALTIDSRFYQIKGWLETISFKKLLDYILNNDFYRRSNGPIHKKEIRLRCLSPQILYGIGITVSISTTMNNSKLVLLKL